MLKGKNLQPRILYSAKISFKIVGEIKNFSSKQKLKEFNNTKLILKEILQAILEIKKNREREKREKEELGWRKPQLESNHLNKPAYRYKKRKTKAKTNYSKRDDKHKE